MTTWRNYMKMALFWRLSVFSIKQKYLSLRCSVKHREIILDLKSLYHSIYHHPTFWLKSPLQFPTEVLTKYAKFLFQVYLVFDSLILWSSLWLYFFEICPSCYEKEIMNFVVFPFQSIVAFLGFLNPNYSCLFRLDFPNLKINQYNSAVHWWAATAYQTSWQESRCWGQKR